MSLSSVLSHYSWLFLVPTSLPEWFEVLSHQLSRYFTLVLHSISIQCCFVLSLFFRHYYFAPVGERSIAISLSVCLSVCASVCLSVREHVCGIAGPIFTKFIVQIPRGSVLLWRRCDTLCTSGFMDDVTFGRSVPYGDAWKAIAALRYRDRVWCLWMPCCWLYPDTFYLYYYYYFAYFESYEFTADRRVVCWLRGTVVQRRSLSGELSLSCARPAADGWPLMWVNLPL